MVNSRKMTRFIGQDPGRSGWVLPEVLRSSLLRSRPRSADLISGLVDLDLPGFRFDATLAS